MSGIIQGLLTFHIMIGNMDKKVSHSTTSSFADDTNICKGIGARGDIKLLQEDLIKIYDWGKKNNMTFSVNKFQLLRSGLNQIPSNTSLLSSETSHSYQSTY